jgi:tetratricopeptide (TPR) repeat protein
MTKKKTKKHRPKPVTQHCESGIGDDTILDFYSYEITNAPIEDKTIPEEIRDDLADIYKKCQKSPVSVIDRLKELIEKYPNVPKLYNFISIAYSNLNDKEKAKWYVIKAYENNPDYLFAKLNYAEICMADGNFEIIPKILNGKFDIKALYPERNVFHISEAVAFMGIVGLYFTHEGNVKLAEAFYNNIKQLAPKHQVTKRLKNALQLKSLLRFFRGISG